MNKLFSVWMLAVGICFSGSIYATGNVITKSTAVSQQKRTIKGTVEDVLGPVAGATVSIKGTTIGTVTDLDGQFSLEASEGQTLLVSFIGYRPTEIEIAGQTSLIITIQEDTQALGEVVVTALGIKKEAKKLGYAVSTIPAGELVKTGTPNFATSLYGKASGVRVQAAPGGSTSAVSINIRGMNSISGTNQPLIIVDGIPIRNGDANNQGYSQDQRVQGNGLIDINPEDIADLSILKGASASALYGSEAANGVVLITTKSGAGSKGVSVDLNVSFGIDKAAYLPKYQTTFGPGGRPEARTGDWLEGGGFANYTYNGQTYQRPQYESYQNFGPRYDGRDVLYWDGTVRKYEAYNKDGNAWNELFRTGTTGTYNVAVTHGGSISNTRFSYTFADNKNVQPESYNAKHNFNLTGSMKMFDRIKLDYSANYMRHNVINRPYRMNRLTNNFTGMLTTFDDVSRLYEKTITSMGYMNVFGNTETPTPDESFLWTLGARDIIDGYMWQTQRQRTEEDINRFISSVTATVNIIEGLDLRARVGTDLTSEKQEKKESTKKPLSIGNSGEYRLMNKRYEIYYGDVMLMFNRQLNDRWSVNATAGYTAREESLFSSTVGTSGGLSVENWFHLSASVNSLVSANMQKENFIKEAFFGVAGVGFNNYLFVEGTIRHEKSSTLLPGENSFTYPSFNGSFLLSEALGDHNPGWVDYAKFRASWGIVGNAPAVYKANFAYNQSNISGFIYNQFPDALSNAKLKPEEKHEMEFGIEAKFLDNRLGFEATYYTNTTKDQIIETTTPWTSGARSMWSNVGELKNSGFELSIYGTPVRTKDFNWELRANIGFNKNKVNKLMDGLDELLHTTIDGAVQIKSLEGQAMGDIYAYVPYEKDGQKVVAENGMYLIDRTEYKKIGNIMTDAVGGFATTFSWKDFFIDASLDFNIGGDVLNTPYQYMMLAGGIEQSMKWRDAAHGGLSYYYGDNKVKIPVNGGTAPSGAQVWDDGMILPGVKQDGTKNDIIVASPTYYSTVYGWGASDYRTYQHSVFKNTYVKMRELALGYTFPKHISSKFACNRLMVSVYGRNLFYFYKNLPAFDAEAFDGTLWTSRAQIGGSTTATRSFGISVRASF